MADPTDPAVNPFKIVFLSAGAIESDIRTTIINYRVFSVDFSAYVAEIAGSFAFTINCPASTISSILVTAAVDYIYDLGQLRPMTIVPPQISFTPNNCFIIVTYVLREVANGNSPAYITISGTEIQVSSSDWTLAAK